MNDQVENGGPYPAVFLDRDGTLNYQKKGEYVTDLSQFVWLPDVFNQLKRLQDAGYKLVVLTNQSAIGRGLTTNKKVRYIHRYLINECNKRGIHIEGVYWCPHLKEDDCDCRKPSPLMILHAARNYNLDLAKSFLVGDSDSDGIAGQAAGCKGSITLKHGENLKSAVDIILGEV